MPSFPQISHLFLLSTLQIDTARDASLLEAIKVIVLVTDWFIRVSSVARRTFIDRCLTLSIPTSFLIQPSSFSLRVEHNFESEKTRVNYRDTIRQPVGFAVK